MKLDVRDRTNSRTAAAGHRQRKDETASGYWLDFADSRWLVYRRRRLIADIPAENADIALAFLRLKHEQLAQERVCA